MNMPADDKGGDGVDAPSCVYHQPSSHGIYQLAYNCNWTQQKQRPTSTSITSTPAKSKTRECSISGFVGRSEKAPVACCCFLLQGHAGTLHSQWIPATWEQGGRRGEGEQTPATLPAGNGNAAARRRRGSNCYVHYAPVPPAGDGWSLGSFEGHSAVACPARPRGGKMTGGGWDGGIFDLCL